MRDDVQVGTGHLSTIQTDVGLLQLMCGLRRPQRAYKMTRVHKPAARPA